MKRQDIEQRIADYCRGVLSAKEERKLELLASNDPLLMDALEGFKTDPTEVDRVNRLKSLVTAKQQGKVLRLKRILAYAASVAALIIVGAFLFNESDDTQIVMDQAEKFEVAELSVEEEEVVTRTEAEVTMAAEEVTTSKTTKGVAVVPDEPAIKKAVQPTVSHTEKQVEEDEGLPAGKSEDTHKSATANTTSRKTIADGQALIAEKKPQSEGDITVGRAHKSTSATRPKRRAVLDLYYEGKEVRISGSLALSKLAASKAWTDIWSDLDQLAQDQGIENTSASLRIKLVGNEVTVTPLKNMTALSDAGIIDFFTDEIGLNSDSAEAQDWLIKLEFK